MSGASGTVNGDTQEATIKESYVARYFVKCSTPLDSPKVVLDHFRRNYSLPWIGKVFSYGTSNGYSLAAVCRTISATPIAKSEGCYEVEVGYEPIDEEENDQPPERKLDRNGKATSNPLEWADEIEISNYQIMLVAEQGTFRQTVPNVGGNPILRADRESAIINSAGVPFDPPPEYELDVEVLRITKYVAGYDNSLRNYVSAVNNDAVTINKVDYKFKYDFGPYTCKIKNVAFTYGNQNGVKFYRQVAELHINPAGWRRQILDRGMARKAMAGDPDGNGSIISASDAPEAGNPVFRRIVDADGYPITEPVLLDGKGQPLSPDKPPVFLEYSLYHETAFAGLAGKIW